jgi:FKBP-type peptidyl-prolyl cis-trans isomerase FkpA
MNSKNILLPGLLIVLITASCLKTTSDEEYRNEERLKIQTFLTANDSISFQGKESGLYYAEVVPGTGISPALNDTAFVFYSMKMINGIVIETMQDNDTMIFSVGQDHVLAGLDEGVTYMKEGGKSMLVLPSGLAFGTQGYLGIPGYSPILMDVELIKVGKK